MSQLSEILYALSDNTRLRILNLLSIKEHCVSDLVKIIKENQPKISRHLAYLKNVGLVEVKSHAQRKIYFIKEDMVSNYPFIRALLDELKEKDEYISDLKALYDKTI